MLDPHLLGFIKSAEPLEKGWMGMMPTRIEPVVDGEAQVVQVEFDQGGLEVHSMTEVPGEPVRLELKMAAEERREEGEDGIVG